MADIATRWTTGKRKREVADLTAEVIDLTESPPSSPQVRKWKIRKRRETGSPSQQHDDFPLKIKPRRAVAQRVKHEHLPDQPQQETQPIKHESPFHVSDLHDNEGFFANSCYSAPKSKSRRVIQKECIVCYDTFDSDILPLRPHSTAIEDHYVCYSCWEKHLHSELDRKEWNKLSCPDCGETMGLDDICRLDIFFQERIEPKLMDKAAKSYLDRDPNWVGCPPGSCTAGAIMEGGHIFTCQECHYRYCFSCNVAMHEGEACSKYHERLRREPEKLREEELSTSLVEKVSKGCPGCSARIQKNHGCDHMTCRHCEHEFCWICLADYGGANGIHRRGNDAHLESCTYAPRRLPNYTGPRL